MSAILPGRYDIPPQPGRAAPRHLPPGEDGTLRAHHGAVPIGIDHYPGNSSNPPASFRLTDWNFSLRNYEQLTALNGLNDSTDPDLSAFQRASGKIIIWQGFADSAINPFGTITYYKAVARDSGGFTASQQFSRLYMIPGGYHCLGGGSPSVTVDLLDPLLRWVENGTAPGAVSAPLTSPTATLTAIPVSPMNPAAPVAVSGGGPGLNASYDWVGQLLHGNELWCDVNGMEVSCRTGRGPR